MKNKNLIYCMIGSFVLYLLGTEFFSDKLNYIVFSIFRIAIVNNLVDSSLISMITVYVLNSISFIGFVLLIMFTVILIFRNSKEFLSKGKYN